jgi:arylsulfatase A-like enzyme
MGLDRNTLLVLFSDHGEEFSEHGFLGHGETLHRQALHVPLIFWAPDLVPRGRRFERPVSLIDVGPTVAELAKVGPLFRRTPAKSRVGWMSEKPEEAMPPVFSELAFRRASCDAGALLLESCPYRAFSLRDERYTFIHVSTSNLEQLFDRQRDPDEGKDIAAARPELLRRFRELLQEYRNSEQPPPLIDAASSRLDEETRRKLRALGYIE